MKRNSIQALTALIDEAAAAGRVLLFKYGRQEFTLLSGGRGFYLFDRAAGERIIAEFERRGNEIPADYEHQMLLTKVNGKPAPASGWIKALRLTDAGLEAEVEWTKTAAAMIAAGEYRYTSPAFGQDEDGRVAGFVNFALTNLPATDHCQELVAASQAFDLPGDPGETETKECNMKTVLTLLGLAAEAPEKDAEAKVRELLDGKTALEEFRTKAITALGLTADAPLGQIEGAILAAKQSADTVTALSTQVAELRRQTEDGKRTALIDEALADGRLSNAQQDWAKTVALDVLFGYLDKTPKGSVVPVSQATGGGESRTESTTTLSALGVEIARNCGLDPKQVEKDWQARQKTVTA
jgi:phage I-like protein